MKKNRPAVASFTRWSPGPRLRMMLSAFFVLFIAALVYGGAAPRLNESFAWLRAHGHRRFTPTGSLPQIWFLRWQMFQYYGPRHRDVTFEGLAADGTWRTIDHRKIFRYRYDSGLRFERPDVWRSRRHMSSLARYVCRQHNRAKDADAPIERLRLIQRSWPKRPGRRDQAPRPGRMEKRILHEEDCSEDRQ